MLTEVGVYIVFDMCLRPSIITYVRGKYNGLEYDILL
jgi:hypothetical protein